MLNTKIKTFIYIYITYYYYYFINYITYKFLFFFFFNDTATTEIYTVSDTLSLHDALPIPLDLPPYLGGAGRGRTIGGRRGRGGERDVAVQRDQVEVHQRPDELRLPDDPAPHGRIHRDPGNPRDDLVGPENGLVVVLPDLPVHLEIVARERELGEVGEIGPGTLDHADVRAQVGGEHEPAAVGAVVLQSVIDGVHPRDGLGRRLPE